MPASFSGKVAVVTGAAGGMGRAIAVAFGQAGADVLAADLATENGEATGELVRETGARAHFVTTDVAGNDTVTAMVLQPDQKIVVIGTAQGVTNVLGYGLAVMRYDTDGTPDTSFGSGGLFMTQGVFIP